VPCSSTCPEKLKEGLGRPFSDGIIGHPNELPFLLFDLIGKKTDKFRGDVSVPVKERQEILFGDFDDFTFFKNDGRVCAGFTFKQWSMTEKITRGVNMRDEFFPFIIGLVSFDTPLRQKINIVRVIPDMEDDFFFLIL
jgi:hypothetical protein